MRIVLISKQKSYATAHLLHSFCSALRRHADSPVSNRFQCPGAKPRLVLHASLPRPGTPRRVPPPRHRYHLRLRWTRYFLRPSSKIRPIKQSAGSNQLTPYTTPPLAVCSLPKVGYIIFLKKRCRIRRIAGAKVQILFVILPSKYKKIGNNLEVGTKFSTFALE